ncbi:proteasome assembly chaperone 1 isoform X4 [Vicugna pacos]
MNSGVWEEVGCAKLWNEWCRTTDTIHLSPTEAFCVFYHLKSNPSVLLCQCSCYVAEDQQFQWLEKVFGSCSRKNMQVTVLTCRHVTDYKTAESTSSLHTPFLKALKTQNFREPLCCSLLEQPNIVHDLPAAVLSYCQVWKIPAVLYLCYTDVMKLDLITVEAFKPVLSSRSLRGLVKNCLAASQLCAAKALGKWCSRAVCGKHAGGEGAGRFRSCQRYSGPGRSGNTWNIPQSTEILKKLMTTNEIQSNIYT